MKSNISFSCLQTLNLDQPFLNKLKLQDQNSAISQLSNFWEIFVSKKQLFLKISFT